MRVELLALLEEGPQSSAQLAAWLEQPVDAITAELGRMERDFQVKHVGPERLWALQSYDTPSTTIGAYVSRAKRERPQDVRLAAVDPIPDEDDDQDDDDDALLDDADDLDAAVAEELQPVKAAPLATRYGKVPPAPTSWWTAPKSRDEFAAAAKKRDAEMALDREWGRRTMPGAQKGLGD